MLERKIRYDGTIAEYDCKLLEKSGQHAVLHYDITQSFSIQKGDTELVVPDGSYTTAFYWQDKNYNVYVLRDELSNYLGSYFNIVNNTQIADAVVSYEDLIIDLLVLPEGNYYILDEDELPEPLDIIENGLVLQTLQSLIESLDSVLHSIIQESERLRLNKWQGYHK